MLAILSEMSSRSNHAIKPITAAIASSRLIVHKRREVTLRIFPDSKIDRRKCRS